MEEKDIVLETEGMGFIMYADYAVKQIKKGEDFLSKNYWNPKDVAKQVNAGKIVGICTGTPGVYVLKIREGIPCNELRANTALKMRVSINVKGGMIYIRDLYDLMEWDAQCDESQTVKIEDGYYTVLLEGNMPNTGCFGDNQVIYMYFVKDEKFNETKFGGVPNLTQVRERAALSVLQKI